MADTATPNILLTNQTEGGNNNTWGTIADNNFEQIDNKFGDLTSITTTGGNTTLSDTQEIVAIIEIDGTLVSNANIVFSGRGGVWVVRNDTAGDYLVTCKVTGQTGVVVPQGTSKFVHCDGTDIDFGNTDASVAEEVTVASATTCDILGAGSEFIAISGSATVELFGTGANQKRFCRATGAFKIKHNATTTICPGAQTINVGVGDTFIVISDSSSNTRIYGYQRASQPPAVLPIGFIGDWPGATAPTYWLFCYGQTLLRADYPGLFAAISTTYGSTDSSNFLLPDCRGRVRGGKDDMGGTSANRLTNQTGGLNGDTLGATGGTETHTLTTAEMPAHTHTFSATTSSNGAHTHTVSLNVNGADSIETGSGRPEFLSASTVTTSSDGAHTHTVSGTTSSAGSTAAHNNVQPTIIFNTIIFAGV